MTMKINPLMLGAKIIEVSAPLLDGKITVKDIIVTTCNIALVVTDMLGVSDKKVG